MSTTKRNTFNQSIELIKLITTILRHEEKISQETYNKIEQFLPTESDFLYDLLSKLTKKDHIGNYHAPDNKVSPGYEGQIGDYWVTFRKIV
jgi:hypothetical protein